MKYIITESKINNLIKNFIFTTIITPNKIRWVDDIRIHHVKNDVYLVEVIINRKESSEMSAGFGFAFGNFSDIVKRLIKSFFGINVMVTQNI